MPRAAATTTVLIDDDARLAGRREGDREPRDAAAGQLDEVGAAEPRLTSGMERPVLGSSVRALCLEPVDHEQRV